MDDANLGGGGGGGRGRHCFTRKNPKTNYSRGNKGIAMIAFQKSRLKSISKMINVDVGMNFVELNVSSRNSIIDH